MRFFAYITALIMAAGCSGVKYLESGQYYYSGASVSYQKPQKMKVPGSVKEEVNTLLRPDPNAKLLGSRPRVYFWHKAGKVEKDKGFKHWMKNKLGRKPVYFSDVKTDEVTQQIEQTLVNNGYFDADVDYEVIEKKHTKGINYIASVSNPYRYDTIIIDIQDSVLSKGIEDTPTKPEIAPGQRYDLTDLQSERARIEAGLKERGYYNFDDNYLLFRADSTIGGRQVDLYMTMKNDAPGAVSKIYTIGQVYVYSNFDFNSDSLTAKDTTVIDGIHYLHSDNAFRPEIIASHVQFKPGNIYRKEHELITLNRLIQLDVFKYVNIDYETISDDKLRVKIFLIPQKKKSVRMELQAVSKSNNFVGPNFLANYKNRNAFRGAETYELNLEAGYEVQISGSNENQALNSYTLGLENVITVPRVISPLNINYESTRFIPQTKFKLGFRTLRRINFFQLNSIEAAYGFDWRETSVKRHLLYPVDIDYIQLGSTSEEFEAILEDNPLLRQSYEEQFILGTTYSFFFNTQNDAGRSSRSNFYFNGNIDLSGNLMHLAQSGLRNEDNTDEQPYEILGTPYSQFVRGDIDFRYFLQTGRDSKLATRLIAGVGYPFGNSNTLPYTKQFAIGGSTSLRAFRARSVGPGIYRVPDSVSYIDQTAEIKFEMNFEYRFPIVGVFKGAVFTDMGNIWTLDTDDNRPGSEFSFSSLINDLAIGTGIGLRIDVNFFVLRFDFAYPLRAPGIEEGSKWLVKNADARSDFSPILNIAIGYPF